MKPLKFAIIFFCLHLFFFNSLYAQKKVSELTVVYDSKQSNGLEGSVITTYIKGNLVRTETKSSFFSSTTIYDAKTGDAVLLREVSGQKLLIRLSHENWQDINKSADKTIFTNTAETKVIAGYKCTKAVGKTNNGTDITVYYTTDIVPDNKDYNPAFKNLDGLPLEYELTNGNFKIVYTVSKINLNPVPASKFDTPKSGYREMTYEESKKAKS